MQLVLAIVSKLVFIQRTRRHTSVGKVAKDGRGQDSHWWSCYLALIEYLLPLFGEQRCWCIHQGRHGLPADAPDGG